MQVVDVGLDKSDFYDGIVSENGGFYRQVMAI